MYPDLGHIAEVPRNRTEAHPENAVLSAAPMVSVIIPCYNHAHFLSEAIESVQAQTHRPTQVVVVDDGSTDDTQQVATRYADVQYIYQDNQGLAAARNTGIRESTGDFLIFLDADDRLLPTATAAGLKCIDTHPDCAFVYGSFRWIAEDGAIIGVPAATPVDADAYRMLLRRNVIAMHGTVLYRRSALEAVGGYDPSLPACEDYDIYLRLAQQFPVACHDEAVAEYRLHTSNMHRNRSLILRTALIALRKQRKYARTAKHYRKAYKEGVGFWVDYFGALAKEHARKQELRTLLLSYAPEWLAGQMGRQALRNSFRLVRPLLPKTTIRRFLRRWGWLAYEAPPPVGRVRFGDLRRLEPVDRYFGYGRGLPVDRYYIEAFLALHAEEIRGRVLEIKDNAYTRRFGGDRVEQCDVLDIDASNSMATLLGDLSDAPHLTAETYDCVVLTQTLHFIYDVPAALATVYRILKPGGVLLATMPGITKFDSVNPWYWAFTMRSARRLFEDVFPEAGVAIETHGNVLAAQAFLQGLAYSELRQEELDHHDAEYPVSIVVRALKPEGSP